MGRGVSNDILVKGNSEGLSIEPILYQARRILPQMLTKTMCMLAISKL